MAQGYVYDPSQQISQSFQQAGQGIGNIFTTIIQQKQRDYNLAENAFQNIEALKKNLNIYGQKNITDKSNALLKDAASAIFSDGKLDYSKLGEIRQKVSDINDLKQGYDLGAKEFERMIQLGIANKDNLVSFEKFYKEMSAKMGDENLVKNPQDLQRQMSEVYSNNLDANKMFTKSFLAANPLRKESKTVDVLDKNGKVIGKNFIQAEMPAGFTFDAKGNKIIDPNLAASTVQYLQQSNPELLALMKKNAGVAGDMLSDEQLVARYINNVPTSIMAKEDKSVTELRIQEATATKAEAQAANAARDEQLSNQLKIAQLNYYNRRGVEEDQQQNLVSANNAAYVEQIPLSGNRALKATAIPLGKNMKLNIGNAQAMVTDIAKSQKTGDIWVKALVDDSGNFLMDENNLVGAKTTWRKVKDNNTFRKTISSAIELAPKAQRKVLQAKTDFLYDYTSSAGIKKGQATAVKTTLTEQQRNDIAAIKANPNNAQAIKGLSDKEILDLINQQ